jgi:hypothetical protein
MTTTASLDFDHVELLIGSVESAADANAKAVRNTVLSPRFYTTDFKAMDRLNSNAFDEGCRKAHEFKNDCCWAVS